MLEVIMIFFDFLTVKFTKFLPALFIIAQVIIKE
jgi:hypothetical protein